MNVTEPGWVTERVALLGRLESCVQLVDGGGELAILGGAMAYVAPDVLAQIERLGIDEQKIARIVILHAHFDHCGMVPILKRRWPWATVTASARAKELLANPRIVQSIAVMNRAAAERFDRVAAVEELGGDFAATTVEVEEVVSEGATLRCDEVSIQVLEVPGHSTCSIAAYLPRERALFASDAVGIGYGGYFLSAGNSNFDLYQASLERMAALDVELLAKEHYGVHTGEDARRYLAGSIEDARRTRALLEAAVARAGGDAARATAEVVEALASGAPEEFLPRDVVAMVVGQMVRYVARAAKGDA
jgi:glyoxylase-like metal-dependent hydrolase (beta-lactamase superfamily II)